MITHHIPSYLMLVERVVIRLKVSVLVLNTKGSWDSGKNPYQDTLGQGTKKADKSRSSSKNKSSLLQMSINTTLATKDLGPIHTYFLDCKAKPPVPVQ